MAALAGHSRLHMLAVVEVNKVRQVVDLHPLNRTLLLHRFFQLFNLDGLLLQQRVAIHADAGRGNTGMAAGARRIVAVQAGNLVIARVYLVRKGDGLIRRIALMDADARHLQRSESTRQGDS